MIKNNNNPPTHPPRQKRRRRRRRRRRERKKHTHTHKRTKTINKKDFNLSIFSLSSYREKKEKRSPLQESRKANEDSQREAAVNEGFNQQVRPLGTTRPAGTECNCRFPLLHGEHRTTTASPFFSLQLRKPNSSCSGLVRSLQNNADYVYCQSNRCFRSGAEIATAVFCEQA